MDEVTERKEALLCGISRANLLSVEVSEDRIKYAIKIVECNKLLTLYSNDILGWYRELALLEAQKDEVNNES